MATIATAAATEDRLALLRALRDKLSSVLDDCGCARDAEPLARRLQSIAEEIEDLASLREPLTESAADLIALRRAKRRGKRLPSEREVVAPARRRRSSGA